MALANEESIPMQNTVLTFVSALGPSIEFTDDIFGRSGAADGFGMTGVILTALGTTISVMWPYTKVPHAHYHERDVFRGYLDRVIFYALRRKCGCLHDSAGSYLAIRESGSP